MKRQDSIYCTTVTKSIGSIGIRIMHMIVTRYYRSGIVVVINILMIADRMVRVCDVVKDHYVNTSCVKGV